MTGSNYWEKRMEALEGMVDRNSRITAAEIGKVYDEALQKIEKDIKKTFHAYAKGYGIPEGEAEKLLSQTQTREIREKLLKLIAETPDPVAQKKLRAILDAPAYAFRISKLEALRAEVYADTAAIGISETAYHKVRLADTYRESYYRTAFDLSQEQGVNVPFHKLSTRQTSAAIERLWSPGVGKVAGNYSTRIWGNTTALAENVRDIITRGILTQSSYSDMIAELTLAMGNVEAQKKITPDGSTQTTLSGSGAKYRAARLVRTECNYISGQARMSAYSDAGIERYFFRARLELRTCKTCGELDGQVFPVSEQEPGVNMHPMHPQCRCFEGPYREKKYLDMVKRAAQTGTEDEDFDLVPQSMTYQQWRRKYVDNSPEMLEKEKELRRKKKDEPTTAKPKTTPRPATSKTQQQREVKPVKVEPKRWENSIKTKDEEMVREEGRRKGYMKETGLSFNPNTPDYRQKVDRLGEPVSISRTIWNEGREMLRHRDGTQFEDLSFISSKTGQAMTRSDYDVPRQCIPSSRMKEFAINAEPYSIIGIHNHPGSSLPSLADLQAARDAKYKFGVILCHDGRIMKYTVKPDFDEDWSDTLLDNLQKSIYSNDRREYKKILKELSHYGVDLEVIE